MLHEAIRPWCGATQEGQLPQGLCHTLKGGLAKWLQSTLHALMLAPKEPKPPPSEICQERGSSFYVIITMLFQYCLHPQRLDIHTAG